jgi:hypothetical protein
MTAGSVLISEMTFINRPLKQNNFLELLDSTLNKIRPDREIIILRDFNTCMKNENHYYNDTGLAYFFHWYYITCGLLMNEHSRCFW